jgi:hypothetical protein
MDVTTAIPPATPARPPDSVAVPRGAPQEPGPASRDHEAAAFPASRLDSTIFWREGPGL